MNRVTTLLQQAPLSLLPPSFAVTHGNRGFLKLSCVGEAAEPLGDNLEGKIEKSPGAVQCWSRRSASTGGALAQNQHAAALQATPIRRLEISLLVVDILYKVNT